MSNDVRKIMKRAKQLNLLTKGGALSYAGMMQLVEKEEISKGFPWKHLDDDKPLKKQPLEIINYIGNNIKFVPVTLAEKADFVAIDIRRRLNLKDANFNGSKANLNTLFQYVHNLNEQVSILASWIPKITNRGGTLMFQSPKMIKELYDLVPKNEDGWLTSEKGGKNA